MENSRRKLSKKNIGNVTNNYTKSSAVGLINELNDDCLISIFKFLPFADRIRIERVCKRWNNIAKKSWSNVKKLNRIKLIKEQLWYEITEVHDLEQKAKKQDLLQAVVQRCCKFLTHIELAKLFLHGKTNVLIRYVAKNCPLLESINVQGCLYLDTLKVITNYCNNLTEFRFCYCTQSCKDEHFSELFDKNQKLHRVMLSYNNILTGECLRHLPAVCLQELYVWKCYAISLETVLKAVSNFENLHTLCYESTLFSERRELKNSSILSTQHKLKTLIISECKDNLQFITKIKHLQILAIHLCTCADDDFLIALTECCKELSLVSIQGCHNVTNIGLKKLCFLPNLNILNIFGCNRIIDPSFINLQYNANTRIRNVPLTIMNLDDLYLRRMYKFDERINEFINVQKLLY